MKIVLETERLLLRQFTVQDMDKFYELESDPEVMRYIRGGKPRSYEQVKQKLEDNISYYQKYPLFGVWAVIVKGEEDFAGWVCLKHLDQTTDLEVGYRLLPKFWRKGYASEATEAVIRYGFEICGLEKIYAVAQPENIASTGLMEKVGMQVLGKAFHYESEVLKYVIEQA